MPKIVGACAMHVSTRTNSVCKERESAGDIENSVPISAAVASLINVLSYVGPANTRTSSVCKELGPAGALEKRANRGLKAAGKRKNNKTGKRSTVRDRQRLAR